jgi:two-component system, OmpR family, phosphate regulon sensor histidine kinase PhoR
MVTGERILVVAASGDLRRVVAEDVLQPAGYDVLTAASGDEGLVLARDLLPDLIIAGSVPPDRDGLALLEALRAEALDLPYILVPAEGSEALAVRALRLGASDYLPPPLQPDDLRAAVQRVLRQHWTHQIEQQAPGQLLTANRKLEHRLRELDTLVRTGQRVTSSLDLQAVLDEVVRAAVQVAQAEEGNLLLVDAETGDLYLYASTDAQDKSFSVPVADSVIGQVVRSGEPLVLAGDDLHKIKTHYLARDLAYIPLALHGDVIGVLGVTNYETSGGFEGYTVQLLSVLAGFAAIAVDNARLYAATEDERDTLNAILRDTEDAIIVVDIYDRVMLCNPAACRVLNVTAEACIGQRIDTVVSHEQVCALFGKDARRARSRSSEIILDEDEGERVLNAQLTVIENVGKVAVMQDITYLKELDRVKSDFVTTVSHDLRSPLTAILGYVELLSRSGPLNDSQQQFVDRIIFSVQSITGLISDLLELGKIEAGFDQGREAVSLSLVGRYAVEGLRHQWETKQQHVAIDLPEDIPPVLGNPLRLRQMANNLVENAIKYTPEGGDVAVSLEAEDEFVILRVRDTGIGIPPEDQPYIFDKFYRSDQAIDEFTGTGLGLSIVKGIVEQHKGRIWVDSQGNQGTTFVVMLPAHTPEE